MNVRPNLYAMCVLLLSSAGCFESHPALSEPCAVQRPCLGVDALGCCDTDRVTLRSVCEMCPVDTVESGECRRAGCETPPVCDTPVFCVEDLGAGCCGSPVMNTSCDACPRGSVTQDRCSQYQPECGCDEIRPLVPPMCVRDLGDGCCDFSDGREVSVCGCPDGYIELGDCSGQNAGTPVFDCAMDLGGGCCGEPVALACGACPAGATLEEECFAFAGEDEDRAPPSAGCYEVLDDGRCGCPVDVNVCGGCPAGTVPEFECEVYFCLMP